MNEFEKIKKTLQEKEKIREKIIALSREILSNSKKAIYETHRGGNPEKLLKTAETKIVEAKKIIKNPASITGSFRAGLEEYAEAKMFEYYINKGKILPFTKIKIPEETYLAALSDFTGELGRLIVKKGINKDIKEVTNILETIDYIFGQMQIFDFPNSDLRRKYDAIKYNLKKAEQIRYDLSLQEK